MIPRLFKPDATDFNAVGYGPITTTIRATVTEELNQAPVLEMELLVTDPLLDTIIVGSIIAAKPNAVDPVQAFVVEEITKPLDGVIHIYAPHIAQHRAQLLVLFTPLNKTGLDNLFTYLSGPMSTLPMNNPFKFVRAENKPDSTRSFKIDTPRTLRETMGGTEGSIIDVFSGEWAFDNFTCTLYSKRGRESGARVLYGRNMTDFNLDEFYDFNLDMSATGCVGWGQYEEDGTTHTIIGDLQVSDNAFDIFPYVRAAAVDFSEGIKYQHTKELVNNLAKAWLKVRGAIGTTAEVAFNHIDGGEDIGMGDTIRIYNNVYNYEARSRVVGLRYDVIAETYESVTIGEQRTTLSEAIQDTAGGSYSYSGGGGGASVDPSTTLPLMDGTAAVGTEQTYARGDHVHPSDTSRASQTDMTAVQNKAWYLSSNGQRFNGSGLELNKTGALHGYGGFIDFHYNGDSADYTSRIVEQNDGVHISGRQNGLYAERYNKGAWLVGSVSFGNFADLDTWLANAPNGVHPYMAQISGVDSTAPTSNNNHTVIGWSNGANTWGVQFAFTFNTNLYIRRKNGSTWGTWRTI